MIELIKKHLFPAKTYAEKVETYESKKADMYSPTITKLVEQIKLKVDQVSTYGIGSLEISEIYHKLTRAYTLNLDDSIVSHVKEDINALTHAAFEELGFKVCRTQNYGSFMGEVNFSLTICWTDEAFDATMEKNGRSRHNFFEYVTDGYHKTYFKAKEEKQLKQKENEQKETGNDN